MLMLRKSCKIVPGHEHLGTADRYSTNHALTDLLDFRQ